MDLIAGHSINGVIARSDQAQRKDHRHYEAAPVWNPAILLAHLQLWQPVEVLAGCLTATTMLELKDAVGVDKRSVEDVVRE